MALKEYKHKRSSDKTPEPFGGKPAGTKLQFVVQKHAASHLHYDFRLEVKGALKSWAIPKGPSMDPAIKHLAMLVEDHPYDYKDFEGLIPKGQYGGGTVIVWDRGTYEPLDPAKTKAEQEKIMLKEFYAGSIKIRMHGKKLKGEFALVRTQGRGENAWLIIKHRDEYASTEDITLQDKSVISRKTIESMSRDNHAKQWQSDHSAAWNVAQADKAKPATEKQLVKTKKPPPSKLGKREKTEPEKVKVKPPKQKNDNKSAAEKSEILSPPEFQQLLKRGKKQSMPSGIPPMLCTLTREPIDDPEYLYEIKWDGYRIISYIQKGKVRMDSRSAIDYTKRYPPIIEALKGLGHDAVVDGEVVVFNDEGTPDFDALQLYNGHTSGISYCVFDLLWLDGYNIMALPLETRKRLLQALIKDHDIFRFSDSFDDGRGLYEEMLKRNLEGVVAKKRDSMYQPDERGNNWLKTPTRKRQEFVIGGWAESDKARSFRSLLFGAYNKGRLEWIGRSGGGYKQKEMPGILKQLTSLETDKSPFVNKVLDTKGAVTHWVKPELVANFEFAAWTKSGRIRKPATFLGFRKDKKAKQVVREIPKALEKVEEEVESEESTNQPAGKPPKKTAPKKTAQKKSPVDSKS
jgi:bifunctional non-homologous end joining protein LigD